METHVQAVLWNIKPATRRAARRCAGTHPGPLGCLSTSPRAVPARSSASATHAGPSCQTPTSCSSGGRKLRVGSAPTMAPQCVTLTLLLMTSSRLVRPLHGLSMGAGPFGGPGLPVPGTVSWALGSGREHAQTLNLKMVACPVWGQRWSTKTAILTPAQLPFPAQPAGSILAWFPGFRVCPHVYVALLVQNSSNRPLTTVFSLTYPSPCSVITV